MYLTSHITHSNGYAPYIAYYRSNGYDQRFRKLKPKPKLNPPKTHRSQIKICENRQTQNVQFRLMPNAFRILKPIQKSSKRVSVFRNTGANAFAKNQMRLAYEDKRDLYCILVETLLSVIIIDNIVMFCELYIFLPVYVICTLNKDNPYAGAYQAISCGGGLDLCVGCGIFPGPTGVKYISIYNKML